MGWRNGYWSQKARFFFFLRLASQTIRFQSFYEWLSFLHLCKIPQGRLLNYFINRLTQLKYVSVCVRHNVQSVCWVLCETYCSFSLQSVRVRYRVQSVYRVYVWETLFSQSKEWMSETPFSKSKEYTYETLSSVSLQSVCLRHTVH
jgi:hypothetical protein